MAEGGCKEEEQPAEEEAKEETGGEQEEAAGEEATDQAGAAPAESAGEATLSEAAPTPDQPLSHFGGPLAEDYIHVNEARTTTTRVSLSEDEEEEVP